MSGGARSGRRARPWPRFRGPSTRSPQRAVADTPARCGEGEGFTTLSGVHSRGQNEKQGRFEWNLKIPAHLNTDLHAPLPVTLINTDTRACSTRRGRTASCTSRGGGIPVPVYEVPRKRPVTHSDHVYLNTFQ